MGAAAGEQDEKEKDYWEKSAKDGERTREGRRDNGKVGKQGIKEGGEW